MKVAAASVSTSNNLQKVLSETDVIKLMLNDRFIHRFVTNDEEWVKEFNIACCQFDVHPPITLDKKFNGTEQEYIEYCKTQWYLPVEYQEMDIVAYVMNRCKTPEEQLRAAMELEMFIDRKMDIILKYMVYLVKTMRKHKIIWGVGRGSSVASYVLYLIGVHRINSLKFNLDITEFLK